MYLRTLAPTLAASGTANGRRGKSSRNGGWRIVGVILAPALGTEGPLLRHALIALRRFVRDNTGRFLLGFSARFR